MKSSEIYRSVANLRSRPLKFYKDESGTLIIFSLFLLVAMLMCVGIGVDAMRYEARRTYIQNTADRAVLAAADLDIAKDPNRNPSDVVRDYFRRAGIPSNTANVSVTPSASGNIVSVDTDVVVPTLLLGLVGMETLSGVAPSTATETITDVEVALVLDNSGSMGSGTKMDDLKFAAKKFVDDVIHDETGEGSVAVSIVPFATQVNPGPLAAAYNLSNEHAFSGCVTFETADFDNAGLSPLQAVQRTAHVEPVNENKNPEDKKMVCPPMVEREITSWSTDRAALKTRIDAMFPYGWTSIELGTKWGLAILDPAARGVVTNMVANGQAPNDVLGMPYNYDRPNSAKYLIVMSDGENTQQWDVRDDYRTGTSPVWKEGGEYYYFNEQNNLFYSEKNGQTATALSPAAVNLTWQDVWAEMTVKFYANRLARRALGGNWKTHYNNVVETTNSNTKNTRTAKICKAARDKGVTVFTIGVGTYGQGDATLLDCAGTSVNFFDITPEELDEAFGAIARQINQLRLTQ